MTKRLNFIASLLRRALWGALLTASLLIVPRGTLAQIASTGNELNVSYGGYTAVILQNSPVNPTLLSGSGTNEFILSTSPNPNTTARVYITNETANACSNLTISFASTANAQISSFNQFPQAWFQVPIIPAQGGQVNSLALTLGANQSITVTTLPIFGNKLVIFLPLSSGCATTNIDMQVILSNSVQPPTANLSSTNTGTSSAPPIMSISDVYSQAFSVGNTVTNPTSGQLLLHVNANNATRSIYFDRVVFSCSAACAININETGALGTTCTNLGSGINQKIGSSVASQVRSEFNCGTNPTVAQLIISQLALPVNGNITLDLRGFIANSTNGIDVTMQSSITGSAQTTFFWYEK